MKKFWYCIVEGSTYTASSYDSLIAAKDEATRLAQLPGSKGKKVYVLEATDVCWLEDMPVHWLRL